MISKLEKNDKLSVSIFSILIKKGLKHTTMDSVASILGMSKRTLYEIYGSKVEMIKSVLDSLHEKSKKEMQPIINESPNIMVALIKIFELRRKLLSEAHVDFFRDMDSIFPEIKDYYKKRDIDQQESIYKLFERGISEGVFRKDANYPVLYQVLKIQMESLKRMEDHFPKEFTLLEVYDTITISFLRSIASVKGIEMLESVTSKYELIENRKLQSEK